MVAGADLRNPFVLFRRGAIVRWSYESKVFYGNRGKPRQPLRTFTEMADHLGITPGNLSWHFRNSKIGYPQSKIDSRSHFGASNKWYDPHEFMKWWRAYSEQDK